MTTTVSAPATAGPETGEPLHVRKARGRRALVLRNVGAILIAFIWFFPLYWMVNAAFMPNRYFRSSTPRFINPAPTLEHVTGVLSDSSFWNSMRMSLQVTGLSVVVGVLIAFLAAVAFSRFRFGGRRGLIIAVLGIQMIPAEALFISQYRMLDGWGLLNSVIGLSLLYLGLVIPFTLWLLKGFIDGVPVELEEAAWIDGCTRMGAFFRIILPLLGPGLVTASIFAIITAWNEYTLALITLRPNNGTLPLWLQSFSGMNRATDWGGIMAGSTLIALPVIILFLLAKQRMASGLTAGAVKG